MENERYCRLVDACTGLSVAWTWDAEMAGKLADALAQVHNMAVVVMEIYEGNVEEVIYSTLKK